MSRPKSQSSKKRMAGAILATLAIATSAWAAISQTHTFSKLSPQAAKLEAPIPPAAGVFIQKRSNSDGLGNSFLQVQLTPDQVKAKQQEGTAEFLSIGEMGTRVLLRDDGAGGDARAGDGLYTGVVELDMEEMQARAALDEEALERNPGRKLAVFEGRTANDIARPVAFDFTGFANGLSVALDHRVAFPLGEGDPTPPPITSTAPVTPGTNTFQDRVLMITDPDVLTDSGRIWNPCNGAGNPNGVWTFNHLMTGITNPAVTLNDTEDLVQAWLETWLTTQQIKTSVQSTYDAAPSRAAMQKILDEWPKLTSGQLDLEKSPLRLLAIVPRVDIRNGTGGGYGGGGGFKNGGELRFIFGFVAKKTTTFDPAVEFLGAEPINSSSCYALPFNVIFEYGVPKNTCSTVRSWAQSWVALKNLTPGSVAYNGALAVLTESIVAAGAGNGPNGGSALNQLRTNEVALGAPWELREFRLQSPTSFLVPSVVIDTPRRHLNNMAYDPLDPESVLLKDWILTKVKPVLNSTGNNEAIIPEVPDKFLGKDFRGGVAHIDASAANVIDFFWDVPDPGTTSVAKVDVLNLAVRDNWARHRVSRATCSGCHDRETFTQFVHVNSAKTITSPPYATASDAALPAELSVFLTGTNGMGDPSNAKANGITYSLHNSGNPKRNFDDLARREQDINAVATMSCGGMVLANHDLVVGTLERTGKLPVNLSEGVRLDSRLAVAVDDIKRNVISEVH